MKKSIRILIISYFLLGSLLKAQLPVGRDTITVIEGGNVLKSAWAGGLNFCMVSQVDLDLDTKLDLVLFDKVDLFAYGIFRCFINKGGVGEIKYVYDGEYSSKFPPVQQWTTFFDYDNDGRSDMLTYVLGGIKVYRNTSTVGNLSFQLIKPAIKSAVTPTNTPSQIYSSPVSIPGFSDIDNDGDMDVLTFSSSGFSLEYHKNMSMETYGNSDSLNYLLDEYTWGDFSESSCIVSLNQFVKSDPIGESPLKVYHSGSCLMCMDREGDGDKDLILGDISCSTLHYLENSGTITNAHISDTTKLYPNYPNKGSTQQIIMNSFPCTYNLDIDNDGDKDLVASPNTSNSENSNSVWYYENTSTTPTVNFQFVKNNFLQDDMIEVGEGAYPCLIDVDTDGLLDLIIGNHGYYVGTTNRTKMAYYRNTGSLSQPSYSLMTRDFANLGTLPNTSTLTGLVPSVADIDADGDKDLIVCDYYGKVHWLENTAGAGNPCNFSIFKNNYFGISTTFPAAYPQVIDVDRDGVLDLIIGLRNGKVAYYRNTGTTTTATFTLVTNSFGNIDVTGDPGLYSSDGSAAPFMYDESGNYKLLVGSISGRIFLYDNIDGNLTGNFNRIDTNVNKINDGPKSALQYIDINGDAKRDLIVGNYAGGLSFYSSKAPIGIKEMNDLENEIVVYPNPANDYLDIKSLNNFTDKLNVEVFDVIGKKVLSQTSTSSNLRINCENLEQGLYVIRINVTANKVTKTLVKKIIIQ
ncbi:MAG: T9SS type A sorting domain-containing protein [Bacteroidia bacterium]|nr:T9SS type A sorting domain-containing protein [Bacteroidia bacterium]